MESVYKPKVIIIGAGISGLSAALALKKTGLVDVEILEASERVGGRIQTSLVNKECVEFGAGWLHDSKNNPLYCLAKEKSIPISKGFNCDASDYEDVKFYTLGASTNEQPIDDLLVDKVFKVYESIYEDCDDLALNGDILDLPRYSSIGQYLDNRFERYLQSEPDDRIALKRSIFEWLVRNECHTCAAETLYCVDIKSSAEYEVEEEISFILPTGYDKIVDCLVSELDARVIKLNHEVKSIQWNDEKSTSGDKVVVLCNNGQSFFADHVIVTLPLGVLKSRHQVLFQPPLPENKSSAIERLGFGVVNRIFLVFEKSFWSDEHEALGLLWPTTAAIPANWPKWSRELYLFYPVSEGSNILIAWLTGEAAIEIENISDEVIGKECVKVLKVFTGLEEMPALLKVEKTTWYKNKLSRGSYTYISKYSSGTDIDILAEPVPRHEVEVEWDVPPLQLLFAEEATDIGIQAEQVPQHEVEVKWDVPPLQLLFAGEATHRTAYATTHGAYRSGVREATRIIENHSKNLNMAHSKKEH